jgi:hypothetical protein
MKYLRKFASHNDYLEAFASIDNEDDKLRFKNTVCIFEDDCGNEDGEKQTIVKYSIRSSDAWVGDLLAWDIQENKWTIINRDDICVFNDDECWISGFDTARYIPDAICVIPASHMEDGKARWCALHDCNDTKYANSKLYTNTENNIAYSYCSYNWSSDNANITTLN